MLFAATFAGPSAFAALAAPVVGAGSTGSAIAIQAWQRAVAQFGVAVNYSAAGDTAGRNDFRAGIVDWAASDIPYGVQDGTNFDPPPARGFAYVPDTAGGLGFMYNLTIGGQRVTNLRLSGPVIAGIFTGVITRWNDPAIAADNPGLALPATTIVPVVRSDGAGSTAQFTQWLIATQLTAWRTYCVQVRNPCTQTSSYPVLPGSPMVARPGDLGVAGYVSQPSANGSIGYVQYGYALEAGFPVAKMLNAAGFYTAPTPGNVAVALLRAKISTNLTQDLSQVYTNPDPRTYPLSAYSYLIVPTTTAVPMTTAKGATLGEFGAYLLCAGQSQVDALGYSALPTNLVTVGLSQFAKVPGATIPNIDPGTCHNPAFSPDGTNALADDDPAPPACDLRGSTQCGSTTGSASGQETVNVAIPAGQLTLTVSGTPVTMTQPRNNGTDLESTGTLSPVTVTNGRLVDPGWNLTGSVSTFVNGPNTFGGNALGWTPTITTPDPANDVTVGPAVAANGPGLGSPATLADATSGHGVGVTVLSAGLDLRIPFTTPTGNYGSTLTLTLLSN